jgi:hypothetical protein
MMHQFRFFEFVPREIFAKACTRWLNSVLRRVPSDSFCRASVTKVKSGYFFSVSVHSSVGSFEAETFLDESMADRTRRDWQLIALEDLEKSMLKQLSRWMKDRKIDVQSSPQGQASSEEFQLPYRKAS